MAKRNVKNNNTEASNTSSNAVNENDVVRALNLLVLASKQAAIVGYDKVKEQVIVATRKVYTAMGCAYASITNPDGVVATVLARIKNMGLTVCERVYNAFMDFFRALLGKRVA